MRLGKCCLILLLVMLAGSCKSGGTSVTVTVTPATLTLGLTGSFQFSASVSPTTTDQTVTWSVNDVVGGNTTVGLISTNGLYTAPAVLPPPASGSTTSAITVTIKAVSTANSSASATATVTLSSGVIITISPATASVGTGETFTFTATVTNSTTLTANWFVNDVAGGSATTGTITMTGVTAVYTAPTTLPATVTVTVRARATADTNQTVTATVTLVTPTNPTLTSVSPACLPITATCAGRVPQGALFQDLYLTGTNFLSTSTVLLAGNPLPSTLISSTLLRARAPGNLLASTGTLGLVVRRQIIPIFTTPALSVNVVPERPALISIAPDSLSLPLSTTTVDFFGGLLPPSTAGDFNDLFKLTTQVDPRHLQVTVSTGDATFPGLYSVGVSNAAASPPRSAVNIAVQSNAAPTVSSITGFNQPVSVAVNTATGVAVVVNGGSGVGGNSISLVNLASNSIINPPFITVGTGPTGVAVDNERNLAVVTDNGSSTVTGDVAIVDLGTRVVTRVTGVGTAPFAVGVDSIQGLALIAYQSTNTATIIDLKTLPAGMPTAPCDFTATPPATSISCTTINLTSGTGSGGTGASPQVAVLPQLGWAIITPGGAGAISAVDLGRRSVVFNATLGTGLRGVAVNTETQELLLTDPTSTALNLLSLLDQAVPPPLTLETGLVAAAINPLTNIGVIVNASTGQASVIDLNALQRLGAAFDVGAKPRLVAPNPLAVAIDPGTNTALVANQGDNTVTVVGLGPIRSTAPPPNEPQVVQVNPPLTFTSGTSLNLRITGAGFVAGCTVRLNGTAVPTTFVSPRQLTALVDHTMFLSAAQRYVVDVENPAPGAKRSNVTNFLVVQAVPVGSSPQAVAIDPDLDLAVVVNSGSNNISLVDMNTGNVTATINVGTNPQGVAVLARAGRAVITNRGSGTASIVDLVAMSVVATVNLLGEPLGVAINQDTGVALVTNNASNSLSAFSATGTGAPAVTSIAVDAKPLAVAVAPELNLAAVTSATSNDLMIVDISGATPLIIRRATGFQLPTGVVYDPSSQLFLVVSSLANNLVIVDPTTPISLQITACVPPGSSCSRVGINPTSLAYNFQTSTLLTANSASNTLSVMDLPNRRVRAILNFAAGTLFPPNFVPGSQFAVDIHPRTNLAVVVDQANNRLLLVPAPR
jgi:YVTN family beta-propeller protein